MAAFLDALNAIALEHRTQAYLDDLAAIVGEDGQPHLPHPSSAPHFHAQETERLALEANALHQAACHWLAWWAQALGHPPKELECLAGVYERPSANPSKVASGYLGYAYGCYALHNTIVDAVVRAQGGYPCKVRQPPLTPTAKRRMGALKDALRRNNCEAKAEVARRRTR